jgi:prepilin-type N-terminal cleavage/methylation domain-containing protein
MARLHTTTRPSKARGGFTLIELLIAVLIIGILATLVTLGVSKAMTYAKQVATKTEMGQIEQALGVAAIEMGRVPYIPSIIKLCNDKTKYGSTALDQLSLRIITQMFPNAWTATPPLEDWDGSGKYNPNGIFILNADRAFVYFLRGPAGNGFSAKGQPTSNPPLGKRFGPYFNFVSSRLKDAYKDGIPVYLDYWENTVDPDKNIKPFLYVFSQMMVGQPETSKAKFDEDDAYKLPIYRQIDLTGKKYWMPKGYQIFSAGKDGLWGPYSRGGQFTGSLTGSGEDDQSNFADEPHGKPIND